MKLLLDTNALIWWMDDEPMLGSAARRLIADPANMVLGTVVSLWEITMKWRIGKFPRPGSTYGEFLAEEGCGLIGIAMEHVAALEGLLLVHKDPFDHLILAQAKVEGARILTSDRDMVAYGIPCIPATR
jgi:PIN domain nuclease of toxin-antitoxin system